MVLWAPAIAASCAFAQVTLSTVAGGVASPAGQVYSYGAVALGSVADAQFRLMNTGSSAVYLSDLSLAGTTLATPPYTPYFAVKCGLSPDLCGAAPLQQLPILINPAGTLNFTVEFEPFQLGSPSATMTVCAAAVCEGHTISIFLTGTGVAGLTPLLNGQPLGAGETIDFGEVPTGSSKAMAVMFANHSGNALTVPAISLPSGGAFTLSGSALAGPAVAPGSSAELDVTFAPTVTGAQQATLSAGLLTYTLQATAVAPPPPDFPTPSIEVNLATPASAQQGSIAVNLANASAAGGSGTVTLSFESAVSGVIEDAGVAFHDGTRSAGFTVAEGGSAGQFAVGPALPFGTGTTAGTLNFTVTLGSNTAQARVTIAAAAIGIDAAVAARDVGCDPVVLYCTATNVQLKVNGWDNTRSASQMTFTFSDPAGNTIAPGAITVDAGSAFGSYFTVSDLAGVFGVNAFFPITGDSNQVAAAQVQITNSVGSVTSAKITF